MSSSALSGGPSPSVRPKKQRSESVADETCRTSPKPAARARDTISAGVKKLMNGVPLALAPAAALA